MREKGAFRGRRIDVEIEIDPNNLPAVFGANFRTARLQRGMTQLDVAEACGVLCQYISKIENGEKNLTLETMQKVAEVVDAEVSTLLQPIPRTKSRSRKG